MEKEVFLGENSNKEVKFEDDDDEEFRSCCADEDELEEIACEFCDDGDEFCVKMFFKGVSVPDHEENGCGGLSGIGVFMERSDDFDVIQVQKKLDFYVEESVADYLALMDGLSVALQHNIRRVVAFTDSKVLYDQITHEETLEYPLLNALTQRIIEHAGDFESFILKLVSNTHLERPLRLAQVAIGIVSFPSKGDESIELCPICCEEKLASMMFTMKCSHKFCSLCMNTYVDGKVESSQVPIRCPELKCRYLITIPEFRSFLPVISYENLEIVLEEANILDSDNICCPFPDCSALLDPCECLSTKASTSTRSDNSCVECPFCQRFICLDCGAPWHSSMSCEEYQGLSLEERDAADNASHQLAQKKTWRRCQPCGRMIELTHGCYHMICWCGHEFCYSCGNEYIDGEQACQCAFWDENYQDGEVTSPSQQFEQWAWDSFGSLSTMMDAYSDQERSQLALIQQFLAGGFGLSDHNPYQSPPQSTDPHVDTLKDLHQLPWLERFVSVMNDDYYDEYTR